MIRRKIKILYIVLAVVFISSLVVALWCTYKSPDGTISTLITRGWYDIAGTVSTVLMLASAFIFSISPIFFDAYSEEDEKKNFQDRK